MEVMVKLIEKEEERDLKKKKNLSQILKPNILIHLNQYAWICYLYDNILNSILSIFLQGTITLSNHAGIVDRNFYLILDKWIWKFLRKDTELYVGIRTIYFPWIK